MAISTGLRWNVLQRDNFMCQYCGAKAPDVQLEIDHLIPQSKGGKDVLGNLVTACAACNGGKGARELAFRDDGFIQDLDYVIANYTSSPAAALEMLRQARDEALRTLMQDLELAWAFTIWDVARLFPPSTFEMCLLASMYSKDEIVRALKTVAAELEAGQFPKDAARVMIRVQRYAEAYTLEFYGTRSIHGDVD